MGRENIECETKSVCVRVKKTMKFLSLAVRHKESVCESLFFFSRETYIRDIVIKLRIL